MNLRKFEYCATCGGDLDTGWECNKCGLDWQYHAYPRWARLVDSVRKYFLMKPISW